MLTVNEAIKYLETGELPENFSERARNIVEFEDCKNCHGVKCMHFVLRDWWSDDIDNCDGYCCPDCNMRKEK